MTKVITTIDIHPLVLVLLDMQKRTGLDGISVSRTNEKFIQVICSKEVDGKLISDSKCMTDSESHTDPRVFPAEDLIRRLNKATGFEAPVRPVYRNEFIPMFTITKDILLESNAVAMSITYRVETNSVSISYQTSTGRKDTFNDISGCRRDRVMAVQFSKFKPDAETSK